MKNAPPVPIALLDDHTLMRRGLVELIHEAGGYEVVLQSTNGLDLIEAITSGLKIDMAVVDLNMPVMDGFSTISWLAANRPMIRSLALTYDDSADRVEKALRAGACCVMGKDIEPGELKLALDDVRTTGRHHMAVRPRPLEHCLASEDHERLRRSRLIALTARELRFIQLVCDPDEPTYEQVGEQMGVKLDTVHDYRRSLFSKLGVRSKTGLVLYALKWDLVQR